MKDVFLRTPYNYDTNQAGDESGLKCEDESRAKQAFAEECDINTIVNRFRIGESLPENVQVPLNEDFDDVFDLRSALHVVMDANKAFAAMPAKIRARFGNDPVAFVDFCSQAENQDEAIKMGIAERKPKPYDAIEEEKERLRVARAAEAALGPAGGPAWKVDGTT